MFLRRALSTAILATTAFAAACGPSMQPVKLSVKGNLPDATVTVDDVLLGSLNYVSKHGVALPPGKHRITVERVGYFPWDKLVLATDQPLVLDIQLTPIPD